MGLIQAYTRLSDADLHEIHLRDSTQEVIEFVYALRDADQTITVNIDKAHDALALMFDRSGLPVNPIRGQGSIPGDINFSEGIPNYMSPDYVAVTRDILVHTTFDTLLDATTAVDLTQNQVSPFRNWNSQNIEYLRGKFDIMAEFINQSAHVNAHVVVELL